MILAGLVCFFWLQNGWFVNISIIHRISVYTIISVPFAFLILFLSVDLINYLTLNYLNKLKPYVETSHQIILIISSAIFIGFLYGLVFGIVDCENYKCFYNALWSMLQDSYPYTLGLVLGFLVGFINEIIRENGGYLTIVYIPEENEENNNKNVYNNKNNENDLEYE